MSSKHLILQHLAPVTPSQLHFSSFTMTHACNQPCVKGGRDHTCNIRIESVGGWVTIAACLSSLFNYLISFCSLNPGQSADSLLSPHNNIDIRQFCKTPQSGLIVTGILTFFAWHMQCGWNMAILAITKECSGNIVLLANREAKACFYSVTGHNLSLMSGCLPNYIPIHRQDLHILTSQPNCFLQWCRVLPLDVHSCPHVVHMETCHIASNVQNDPLHWQSYICMQFWTKHLVCKNSKSNLAHNILEEVVFHSSFGLNLIKCVPVLEQQISLLIIMGELAISTSQNQT